MDLLYTYTSDRTVACFNCDIDWLFNFYINTASVLVSGRSIINRITDDVFTLRITT